MSKELPIPSFLQLMATPSQDKIRRTMQSVKSAGSKIEIALGKALWNRGCRYRKNDKSVFGKPDFTFKKLKIAVFVDSEFWHGKDWERRKLDFRTNKEFWLPKIERNIQRDIMVTSELRKQGWIVLRFWGEQIQNKLDICVENVEKAIHRQKEASK